MLETLHTFSEMNMNEFLASAYDPCISKCTVDIMKYNRLLISQGQRNGSTEQRPVAQNGIVLYLWSTSCTILEWVYICIVYIYTKCQTTSRLAWRVEEGKPQCFMTDRLSSLLTSHTARVCSAYSMRPYTVENGEEFQLFQPNLNL